MPALCQPVCWKNNPEAVFTHPTACALHLLPEDSIARANRPTRGRPRKIPETQDLVPEATNTVEKRLSEASEMDAAAQGKVPLAVACGERLTTSDRANPTVVGDALSVAVEGIAAQADVGRLKLRPSTSTGLQEESKFTVSTHV